MSGEERQCPAPWLDFLWLEVTAACNLRCTHCYADSSPAVPLHQGLNAAHWCSVMDEAAAVGCRKLQFIGGEPTLYPALPGLIAHARQSGYAHVEVYTNGTMFRQPLRRALQDHNVALAFSVYANEAATHDAVTQSQGSFARTIENLKWALASRLPVRVGLIDTGANTDAVTGTHRFLQDLGVTSIRIDRKRGVGRGSDDRTVAEPISELCGRCWQGRLCVTAKGDAIPCVFSRSFPVGTIEEGIASILKGDALAQFRHLLYRRTCGTRDVADAEDEAGGWSTTCMPVTPYCVPLGDPCSPEEFHPCVPMGGRTCVPLGGACTPESPPCGPEGGCGPNEPPA